MGRIPKKSEKYKITAAKSQKYSENIINTLREPIVILDQDLMVVTGSFSFYKTFDVKPEEAIGHSIYDLGNKQLDTPKLRKLLETILPQKTEFNNYEIEYNFTIGGKRTMLLYGRQIKGDSKKGKLILLAMEDITERRKMENVLRKTSKALEITLASIGDGVISTDKNGNIAVLNRVAEALTGWTQEEAKGKPIEEVFNVINKFTLEKNINIVKRVIESRETDILEDNSLLISKDGIERAIEDSAAPIFGVNGEIDGIVLVFRDVTEKKRKQDELEFQSFHDQLTGLYNRRFYEEEVRRLDVERNLPITIALGDVNGLKLINDSLGHAVGDELLIKAAEAITKGCRADDIIARLGGDEFVIIFPKTDTSEAAKIIKRIKDLSSKEKVGSISLSITFGFETKKEKGENIREVFKNTEDHMYRHKLSESLSLKSKIIPLIMETLYEKNHREMLHSKRVSELCADIATGMYLGINDIEQIKIAGLLHDIGKIAVDEKILNKPGKLTEYEWVVIKRHSEVGYRILSSVNEFSEIAEYILEHHEKWDGGGYPRGIKGKKILLQARIISIANAFDAMTSKRPYGEALTQEEAIKKIKRGSGTHFDPEISRIFTEEVLRKNHNGLRNSPG